MDTNLRPGKGMHSSTKAGGAVVGFRLPKTTFEELQRRAAAAGERPSAFARRVLVEALGRPHQYEQRVLGALGELRSMMLEDREARRRFRSRRFEDRRSVPVLGLLPKPWRPLIGTIADLRLPPRPGE
jgi:hypothetical protein